MAYRHYGGGRNGPKDHYIPGAVPRHNGMHGGYDAPPIATKREPEVGFMDPHPAEELFLEHHERYGFYHAYGCEPCSRYARHITTLWRDDPAAFRRAEQEARVPPPGAQHSDTIRLLADHRELSAQVKRLQQERSYFDTEYNRLRDERDYWRSRAEGTVGSGPPLTTRLRPVSPLSKGRIRNRSPSPFMDQDAAFAAANGPPRLSHRQRGGPLVAQNSAEFSDPYESRVRYEASSSSAPQDFPRGDFDRQVAGWVDGPRDQVDEHPRKRPRTDRHFGDSKQEPGHDNGRWSRTSSIEPGQHQPPSPNKSRSSGGAGGGGGREVHWPRSEHSLRNIVRRAQAGDPNMQNLLRGLIEKLALLGSPRTPVQRAFARNYQPLVGGPPTLWSTVPEHIEHWKRVPNHRPHSVGTLEDGITPHPEDAELYVMMRMMTPNNIGTRPFIDKCAAVFGIPGEYARILAADEIETSDEAKLESQLGGLNPHSQPAEIVKAFAKAGLTLDKVPFLESYYQRRAAAPPSEYQHQDQQDMVAMSAEPEPAYEMFEQYETFENLEPGQEPGPEHGPEPEMEPEPEEPEEGAV